MVLSHISIHLSWSRLLTPFLLLAATATHEQKSHSHTHKLAGVLAAQDMLKKALIRSGSPLSDSRRCALSRSTRCPFEAFHKHMYSARLRFMLIRMHTLWLTDLVPDFELCYEWSRQAQLQLELGPFMDPEMRKCSSWPGVTRTCGLRLSRYLVLSDVRADAMDSGARSTMPPNNLPRV
jgi:hypothetical protein